MAQVTPMMQNYLDTKEKYKDCILFYRLGDFYEMFFDDAITVSKELELTLTGKDCGLEERAPMCGIPHHARDTYIPKLVEKGYKVAICEQLEDPRYAKGIVKRTTYHVFWMYTNLLEQNVLPIHLNSELLLWKDTSTDKVDAVLSSNNERTRFVLAAVNKDPSKDVQLQLDFVSLVGCVPTQVEATILSGSSPDDYNDVGAENRVIPVKQTLTVKDGAITLPPHSLSFITIQK